MKVGLILSILALGASFQPQDAKGQIQAEVFPQGMEFPRFLAGPRDPVSSANVLWVPTNPNQHGEGIEVEVSVALSFPVLLILNGEGADPILVGIETAAFARFGLQVLERELINTDWVFTVPVLWPKEWGWVRFRYYHSSGHLGDEYNRRFEDPGVNFSRDAADLFALYQATSVVGVYGGMRYGYNVHPEGSGQMVLRTGVELQAEERGQGLLPYLGLDLEWDEDTTPDVRLDVKAGAWLPAVGDRRTLRLALGLLTGPSPLGQFQRGTTTQLSFGLQGFF